MTLLIKPVLCYCSLKQVHTTNHIECRCDGNERFRAATKEFLALFKAKKSTKDVLWPKTILSFPSQCKDEDGYPLCRYCGKIAFKRWLVQCPYCDKYFKGPTFWFNKKFHYECEDCG